MESRRSVAPTGMRLDATFAALADPTRRAILARLASGEASVTELARPFAISQPAISKHLKVLERAGLISRRRDAQRRPRWLGVFGGWTLPVCEIDLRVGGKYRFVWRNADGSSMGMGGVYREIVRPDRLVNTEKFDDAWYPGEALITSVLVEKAGKTTLTVM